VSAPPFFACIKKFSPPKVFRLQKKKCLEFRSFSFTKEKLWAFEEFFSWRRKNLRKVLPWLLLRSYFETVTCFTLFTVK